MGLLDERYGGSNVLPWGAGYPSPLLTPPDQDAAARDAAAYGAMGVDPTSLLPAAGTAPFSFARPAAGSPPTDVADIAKSAGIGLVNGTVKLAGTPADLATGFGHFPKNALANAYLTWSGLEPLPDDAPEWLDDLRPDGIQQRIERRTGPFYRPETTAGRYAETIGEMAPAILGGAGARGLAAVARGTADAAAAGAGLLDLGKTLGWHAVVPGLAIQGLEEMLPDSRAWQALQRVYPWLRRGIPLALATKRHAFQSPGGP